MLWSRLAHIFKRQGMCRYCTADSCTGKPPWISAPACERMPKKLLYDPEYGHQLDPHGLWYQQVASHPQDKELNTSPQLAGGLIHGEID